MAETEPTRQPILNIVGEKVALGPHRRDLLPLYQQWLNDFQVTGSISRGWLPITRESETEWYEGIARRAEDILFLLYERATLRPIGSTGLHHVDHQHRTAEFGILIGEKECWGKGYGTEAARLMLDYGFTGLGLHSIVLHVLAFNHRAIRAYQRAGFRQAGVRRECHFMAGRYYDLLTMDCLSPEFQSPVLHRLLPDQAV